MSRFKYLTGQKFGRLTVIRTFSENRRAKCECICECGKTFITRTDALRNGRTLSCGCLHKEISQNQKPRLKHGKRQTRLYNTWTCIKQRCLNSKCKSYIYYGGRGITICEEWKKDFMSFYNWAMSNGYNDTLSIDRINVNGNYEPSNCRWTDKKTQLLNTTQNHKIKYRGQIKTISEWAEKFNLNYKTLHTRLNRGWSISKALNTPLKGEN